MTTARDVRVVAGFEIQRSLRTPQGILFLVFFGTFYVWACSKLASLDPATAQAAVDTVAARDLLSKLFAWFASLDEGAIAELMSGHSPLLVGFFFLTLFATPLLAMLASFDQTATDIGTRHARFLLLRTSRSSLYIGKTIGALVFFATCMGLATVAGLVVYLSAGGALTAGALAYLVRIWVSAVFFALPFIALMGLTSALTGHAFLSLLTGIGGNLVIWMMSAIGGIANPALHSIAYLFPTAFKFHLLSDRPGDVLLAVAHQGGMAALFFGLGYTIFLRRDL